MKIHAMSFPVPNLTKHRVLMFGQHVKCDPKWCQMIQHYNLSHQTKGEQSGCKPPKLRRVGMPWGIWFRKFNVQLRSPRPQVIESPAISFRYNMVQHAWTMSRTEFAHSGDMWAAYANRIVWKHLATSLLAGQGVTQTFSTKCDMDNHGILFYALEEREGKIPKRLWTFSDNYNDIINSNFFLEDFSRFIPSSLALWVAQLVIASAMTLDTSAGSLCNDRPCAPPSGSHISLLGC